MSNGPHRIARSLLVTPFLVSMLWYYLAQTLSEQAAGGFSGSLGLGEYDRFLASAFLLFLIGFGFAAIAWIGTRQMGLRKLFALPNRPGWQREFGIGAAVGWGMVIVAVLPMAFALHPFFWLSGRSIWLTFISLLGIAFGTLAIEATFRGYPFLLLIDCLGENWATVVMALLFALLQPRSPESPAVSFLTALLLGLLLSVAYLRTHALWLPWGLHFAWSASMGVLFGLPVHGTAGYATMLEMRPLGLSPIWLTGDIYGPAGAVLTPLVLLGGLVVLMQVTRDYAWHYTHAPIVAAGYPMEPPVPAAHVEMEKEAQKRAGDLVQILPTTPRTPQAATPPPPSEPEQDA